MTESISVVMLAGTIRPSPLRAALDVPALCLPMGARGALLDTWLEALTALPVRDVTIVLNSQSDVEAVGAIARAGGHPGRITGSIRPVAEPAAWRGAAGLLRDMTEHVETDGTILVVEAAGLPPRTLAPIAAAMGGPDAGIVGVCGDDQPAGVYAFTRHAIEQIPRVGYYDLKEQLLPNLYGEGEATVRAAVLGERVLKIHDRAAYLDAVAVTLAASNGGAARVSSRASVSGSAIVQGACIIESGAVIEDGAVVHDSVVLAGATIGGGAIVSRSVIGPLTNVAPRRRVMREIAATTRQPAPQAPRRSVRRTGREARTP